jgi:hypothetical protein
VAKVRLGQVLDLVLPPRRGLLHGERHGSGLVEGELADWI